MHCLWNDRIFSGTARCSCAYSVTEGERLFASNEGLPFGRHSLHSIAMCRKKARVSDWDAVEATPSASRWDATPGGTADATPGRDRWDATPGGGGTRWDATPGRADGVTPARKNRWDETPTPGRVRFNVAYTFPLTMHCT